MFSENQKPRLGYYRALLSRDKPDIEEIMKKFLVWVEYIEYLIFRRENIYTYEKTWKAVKASKRGNDVYSWRLRKRIKKMYDLPEISFFNRRNRSKRQKTRAVFTTLTYRREGRIDTAWEGLGVDNNRWISALRRRYGKIRAHARVMEVKVSNPAWIGDGPALHRLRGSIQAYRVTRSVWLPWWWSF